jgi:hypothetical protein
MVPSSEPPKIVSLPLEHPTHFPKTKWAPPPNYTRPIPLTASICLDFSSPSAFSALDSRPAIILAPARTWHPGVGLAMWEQAKARAEEVGSMVLWCDGGEGGVSGVAGGGMTEFMQFGEGSWLRTIGVQWPFDETPTFYARGVGGYMLLVLWALLGGDWAVGLIMRIQSPKAGLQLLKNTLRQLRAAAPLGAPNGETRSLLD